MMMTNKTSARTAAAVVSFAIVVGSLGAAGSASAAEPAALLHYTFDTVTSVAADAVVPDESGAGLSATVVGDGAELVPGPSGLPGDQALSLPGGANTSSAAYLRIAPGLNVAAGSDLTISTWVKWTGAQLCAWPFTVGSSEQRHVFATTQCGDGAYGAIRDGYEVRASTPSPAPTGIWTHLAVVVDGGTSVSTYIDGELAGSSPTSHTASAAQGTAEFSGYLGRSFYAPDPRWGGVIDDVEVYGQALTADQLRDGQSDVYQAIATSDAQVDLGDLSHVTASLALPATGASGSAITWTSSAPGVIAADGTVTRPAAGEPDAVVTLTPTAERGGFTATGPALQATVIAYPEGESPASDLAQAVVEALKASPTLASPVLGSVSLPETGAELPTLAGTASAGSATITWSSSSPAISTADTGSGENVVKKGSVTRTDADTTVTLTATVSVPGTADRQVPFTLDLPALHGPTPDDLQSYMFAYFTGDSVDGEKIRFAVADGNNALDWDTLNAAQPVLESTLGTKGLRDPFIFRSKEGDRFFLIATDLSVGRTGWGGATDRGSRYLEIWESTDLVNWGEQRHVEVNLPNAGMTWAPEASYDSTIDAYVVYWTSSLYTDDTRTTGDGNGPQILTSITRDFRTFSEPTPWFKAADLPSLIQGNGLIDSTVLHDGDTYYRFTKASQKSGCASPDIIGQKSDSLRATTASGAWQLIDECIGRTAGTPEVEGPSIFKANPGDVSGFAYYLWVDNYGGRGYIPLGTDSLEGDISWTYPQQFSLPASPRHGSVLAITRAERDALAGKWGPNLLVTAVAPSALEVQAGASAAPLPPTVQATFGDGSTRDVAVTWDALPSGALEHAGEVTVHGDLANGSATRATAVITVVAAPGPEVHRIGGADRFEVSVNTSKAAFPNGSDTVFVASGAVFPDALSAAPAATVAGAPILLTAPNALPAPVSAEITRLGATKITIVGGAATVSPAVEAALKKLGTVTRIGGADRYEASRNIARAAFPDGASMAVLATGATFPDALSAGAAVHGGGPVILVNGAAGDLDAPTKSLLTELGVTRITIVGGEASVSVGIQAAAATIADTSRLGGADRYDASRTINAAFFDHADHVLLATGEKFADALAGSAYAPTLDAPLFAVTGGCVPAETLAQITALGASTVTLLGGPATLSDDVESLTVCR
jgi:putative cell wall-binding protein